MIFTGLGIGTLRLFLPFLSFSGLALLKFTKEYLRPFGLAWFLADTIFLKDGLVLDRTCMHDFNENDCG
jgi:hypothetical protein